MAFRDELGFFVVKDDYAAATGLQLLNQFWVARARGVHVYGCCGVHCSASLCGGRVKRISHIEFYQSTRFVICEVFFLHLRSARCLGACAFESNLLNPLFFSYVWGVAVHEGFCEIHSGCDTWRHNQMVCRIFGRGHKRNTIAHLLRLKGGG